MAAIAGTSTLSELANVALEVAQDMRTDGDPSDPCPPCDPQHRVGERQPRVPPAARRHEQGSAGRASRNFKLSSSMPAAR
jgi:hypothetical protein